MAEPKVRFKRDDGTLYPDLRNATMGDFYTERNERGEKGLPMLTVSIHSGISDGELDEEELGKRVNRSADVSLYKKAAKGDLVFNMMRAWQGAVGSTKSTGMVSPAYIVASPNKEIDPTFMNYYVQTKTIINRFNRLSYGALDFRKRLYWDSFIAAEVNIPVIEEQQKIADFLSSVDEVIAVSEQEVANLETQKKAVMKKIFSQEVRFKREDGTDFPEWERNVLLAYAKIIMGQSPEGSSVNEDGNGEYLIQGKADLRGYRVVPDRCTNKPTKVCEPTDLIMTVRAPVGFVTEVGFRACIGRGVCAIRANEKTFERFIRFILENNEANWRKIEQGSTFTAISSEDVENFMVSIPCLEEQHLIADFLSDFNEAIAAAKKELELWKELKKGLLQQMFV